MPWPGPCGRLAGTVVCTVARGAPVNPIYIGAAAADYQPAQHLATALGERGVACWWVGMAAGFDSLPAIVGEHLMTAEATLLLWSAAAQASGELDGQIQIAALRQNAWCICLDETPPPPQLRDALIIGPAPTPQAMPSLVLEALQRSLGLVYTDPPAPEAGTRRRRRGCIGLLDTVRDALHLGRRE